MYIHERDNWTDFRWDTSQVSLLQEKVFRKQGLLTEVNITEENGVSYLNALYKGKKTICERILRLDAERYQKGDLPLANLLSKYCSYIVVGNRDL